MDLNLFYSQHQIAVFRAAASTTGPERARHLAKASCLAGQIGRYQTAQGAPAGPSWRTAATSAGGVAQ